LPTQKGAYGIRTPAPRSTSHRYSRRSSRGLDTLCEAFIDYPPRTSDDPTIGMCWDSCRLAVDVGIGRAYLSTTAARAS